MQPYSNSYLVCLLFAMGEYNVTLEFEQRKCYANSKHLAEQTLHCLAYAVLQARALLDTMRSRGGPLCFFLIQCSLSQDIHEYRHQIPTPAFILQLSNNSCTLASPFQPPPTNGSPAPSPAVPTTLEQTQKDRKSGPELPNFLKPSARPVHQPLSLPRPVPQCPISPYKQPDPPPYAAALNKDFLNSPSTSTNPPTFMPCNDRKHAHRSTSEPLLHLSSECLANLITESQTAPLKTVDIT